VFPLLPDIQKFSLPKQQKIFVLVFFDTRAEDEAPQLVLQADRLKSAAQKYLAQEKKKYLRECSKELSDEKIVRHLA